MKQDEKSIYLVFSNLGTRIGKFMTFRCKLQFWNRYDADDLSHVSLSLDDKFDNMVSFARRKRNNPLNAGLIKESIHAGFFEEKQKTGQVEIIKLNVTEEQYNRLKNKVNEDMKNSKDFHYNFISCITMLICSKGILKDNKRYVCSQYVTELLQKANILDLDKYGYKCKNMKPFNIHHIYENNVIFSGTVSSLVSKMNEENTAKNKKIIKKEETSRKVEHRKLNKNKNTIEELRIFKKILEEYKSDINYKSPSNPKILRKK